MKSKGSGCVRAGSDRQLHVGAAEARMPVWSATGYRSGAAICQTAHPRCQHCCHVAPILVEEHLSLAKHSPQHQETQYAKRGGTDNMPC